MKKGETIKVGWKELLTSHPLATDIKGYSSAKQIANAKGISECHVLKVLSKLRREGKIQAIQAKNDMGKLLWMYKD